MSGVHTLNISRGSGVTDAAFAHLRGIDELDASSCDQFTDAALSHLRGIRRLNLRGCDFSSKELAKLLHASPRPSLLLSIEEVISMLNKESKDLAVAEYACRTLRAAAAYDPHRYAKGDIIKSGGEKSLINAIYTHRSSAAVAEHACAAMRRLTEDEGGYSEVWRAGGVDAAKAALAAHPSNLAVAMQACAMISNVYWEGDAGSDSTAAVLSAHVAHPQSAFVALQALAMVESNAYLESELAGGTIRSVLAPGGAAAAVAALAAFPDCPEVTERACEAIRLLTRSKNGLLSILAAGGADALKDAATTIPGVDRIARIVDAALLSLSSSADT